MATCDQHNEALEQNHVRDKVMYRTNINPLGPPQIRPVTIFEEDTLNLIISARRHYPHKDERTDGIIEWLKGHLPDAANFTGAAL